MRLLTSPRTAGALAGFTLPAPRPDVVLGLHLSQGPGASQSPPW